MLPSRTYSPTKTCKYAGTNRWELSPLPPSFHDSCEGVSFVGIVVAEKVRHLSHSVSLEKGKTPCDNLHNLFSKRKFSW